VAQFQARADQAEIFNRPGWEAVDSPDHQSRHDPQEREAIALPYLHTWTAIHFNRILGQFSASTQREPSVPDGAGVRRVLDRLSAGERALAVGHSPTNEAAVFDLTGKIVAPLSTGRSCSSSPRDSTPGLSRYRDG
jgi:hypothetical protein